MERRQEKASGFPGVSSGGGKEALPGARQDWEGIFQAVGRPMMILDSQRRVIAVNRAMLKTTGKREADVLGNPCYALLHEGRPPEDCPFEKARTTGRPETREKEIETAGGVFLASCTPVLGADGRVERLIYTATDITEQKRAAAALRLTQFTVDRVDEGAFWIGPDARLIYVNDAACRSLGYSRQELLSLTVHDMDPEFPREVWPGHWEDLKRRGVLAFESRHRRKDGTVFPVEVRTNFLEFEGREYNFAFARDITSRKRAETALREGEQFLENVFDGIRDGLSVLDRDLTIVRVNAWMQRMCASEAPLVGRKCYEAYEKRTSPCPACPSARTIRTGKVQTERVPWPTGRNKDGWMELSSFPIKDTEGNVTGVIEHVKDITVRMHAEQALRSQRDLLERITETSPAGITVVDRAGRIIFANAATEKMIGLPRETITQRTHDAAAWKLTDHEGRPIRPEDMPFHRVRATGKAVHDMPLATESPDGCRVLLSLNAAPLFDESGEFDGLVVTVTDVTQEVRRAEELREERDFANSLVETAQSIVVVLDTDARVVQFNRFAEELTGYSGKEIRGRDWFETFLAPGDQASVRAVFRRILEGNVIRGVENTIRTKDGRQVLVRWYNSALQDADGRAVAVLSIGHDMTEIREKEEQLRRAQKMEAVGRLAGGIAHDFNNQLTIIKGYCDLLLAENAEGSPTAELQEIHKAAERARQLTGQLLAFGRKQVLNPKVTNLNEILLEMQNPLSRMIGEDIRLSVFADPTLGNARVDRSQVHQAVMNLAVNARDAMPDGGRLTIETANVVLDPDFVRLHPDASVGPHVMLAIRDTGTGMDEQTVARIFDPFFTTKDIGKGTGLGLSMVYGFVRQSGGSIHVDSELDVGTTLKVYLPQVFQPEEESPTAPPADPAPRGTQTVLVAEDDPAVRQFITQVLRDCGYTVLEAGSTAEAVSISSAHRGEINVLVTDVVMPAMSGPQLAARLRQLRPDLRALYVSGYPRDAFARHSLVDDGAHLLSKPFTPKELAYRVRRALGDPGAET